MLRVNHQYRIGNQLNCRTGVDRNDSGVTKTQIQTRIIVLRLPRMNDDELR